MPDRSETRPALSDHALRETLDLLGEVVAAMSKKLDDQGETQARMIVTMINGLKAILDDVEATRAQIDPAGYARHIGVQVENALDKVLDEFAGAVLTIRKDHETTAARLKELEQAEEAALARLRQDLDAAARWRRQVPWVWAGAVSTALVLAVVLKGLV